MSINIRKAKTTKQGIQILLNSHKTKMAWHKWAYAIHINVPLKFSIKNLGKYD